jgi:lysylphosphatidylglycerol synthetase-like protein (DUF2156 family)
MGGFRGGGMGMSMRAERSPHGRSARAGQAEPPKSKPNLRKIWPEVKALVVPRKGLIAIGLVLMAINRVAGLVLPFTARPLVDKVLSPQNPHPQLLPRYIAIVFSAMVVQAITSYALTQSLSKGRAATDCRDCAARCSSTWACFLWHITTRTAPARWWRGS